jgi:hypothetical protein
MTIIAIISFLLGIFIGWKVTLLIQLIILVSCIFICNSRLVNDLELGAIYVVTLIILFHIGVLIGDIGYLIIYADKTAIAEGAKTFFTPM